MGSPSSKFKSYRYTGDANAATVREFSPGWQPKKISIKSAEGETKYNEGLSGWFKRLATGVSSFLAESPELTEYGMKFSSVDDTLNKNAVEYFVELEG